MDIIEACKQTADNLSALHAMEGKKPQTVAGVAIMMVLQYSKVKLVTIDEIAAAVDIKPSTIQDILRQCSALREHVLPEFWQHQLK
jgi:transcription initiation factor TFIIIB Brf1 subunit/transcription initiation factor TFIIB